MRRVVFFTVMCAAGAAVAQAPLDFGVDTHVHLTMSGAAVPLFHGEPGDGQLTRTPGVRLINQVEAGQLLSAGVRLVYGALWIPLPMRPGRDVFDETAHQVELMRDFAQRRPQFALVTTAAEAREAIARGRVATFVQIEGGEGVRHVDDVDRLYALGVRCLTIVHFVDNPMAGAAHGQMAMNLLGIRPGRLSDVGLSPLGKEAIVRMMDVGMVIDISHASDKTARDVLALTEPRGVPVIWSHGGARTLMNVERNVPDDIAQRVAKGGGLIGVTMYPAQLETDEAHRLSPHEVGTCDDMVAHWKYLAGVVGPGALVFGSDLNGFTVRPKGGGRCEQGLRNTGDLGGLFAALEKDGVPRAALDGMGEKLLRLIELVEVKADPMKRARALAMPVRIRPPLLDVP